MSDTPTSGEFAEQFGEKPVMRSEVDATRIGQLEKELADTKRELEMVREGVGSAWSQGTLVMRNDVGPLYGVQLLETLPISGGFLQQMPTRGDLDAVRKFPRVQAGYEVLLAHYLKLRSKSEQPTAEPRYTLAEAIDKIVDGLRLEWRVVTSEYSYSECVIGASMYRLQFDGQGWFYAINKRRYTRCATYEDGQNYCLADYKTRFRAEIERAVKS